MISKNQLWLESIKKTRLDLMLPQNILEVICQTVQLPLKSQKILYNVYYILYVLVLSKTWKQTLMWKLVGVKHLVILFLKLA